MGDLIKKLMESGKKDAFDSVDGFLAAAKELGYSEEEIEKAMDSFDGFPLDDEELDEVAGGLPAHTPPSANSRIFGKHYCRIHHCQDTCYRKYLDGPEVYILWPDGYKEPFCRWEGFFGKK